MRRRVSIILLAALVLGSATAGGLYWRWLHSPRYALQQMALALKARDMDKFFNYLILKDIFANLIEESTKDNDKPGAPPGKPEDEWTRATKRLGHKLARQILPKLFDRFSGQLRGVIETHLLNLDDTQILAVMAAVTVARIDTKGDKAQVTLRDPKTGDPLRFQMARCQDGNWRVVSVTYEDFRNFLKNEWCRSPS